MTDAAPVLGVLAGVVGVADVVPYVRDTTRRSTCPHRGTWLIWSVLAILVCVSQRADGASWSLIMSGTQAVLISLVFVLAIKFGVGGLSPAEGVLLAIAGLGVAGWLVVDAPIVATACVVAADLVGVGMMVPKTWREPDSETLSTFALASVSGAMAAGSVATLDPALLLYPVYFWVGNGALALLILHRRAALSRVAQPPAAAHHPQCPERA
jgi:hypothetical protein